jgi:hypothetical protein
MLFMSFMVKNENDYHEEHEEHEGEKPGVEAPMQKRRSC